MIEIFTILVGCFAIAHIVMSTAAITLLWDRQGHVTTEFASEREHRRTTLAEQNRTIVSIVAEVAKIRGRTTDDQWAALQGGNESHNHV